MSTTAFEAFLARIYVDPDARARFKADPYAEARRAGLFPEECAAIVKIDWVGLELATRSFAKKRRPKVLIGQNAQIHLHPRCCDDGCFGRPLT